MTNPTATIFLPYHALDDVIQRGTRAAQPAAGDVVPGTLYCVTDESNRLERSDGTTWALYAPMPSGGQSSVVPYRFSSSTVEPATTGQIKFDNATYVNVTKVWISVLTRNNDDVYWGLMLTAAGSLLLIQNDTDHTHYVEFATDGAPIDKTTYVEFPVHFVAGGIALAHNETVLLRTSAPAPELEAHHATHETGGTDPILNVAGEVITSGTLPDARLSSNVALENAANVFTATQTIEGVGPSLLFTDSTQAADQRIFRLRNSSLQWSIAALNDALSAGVVVFSLTRPGNAFIAGDVSISQNVYEKGRGTAIGHWIDVAFDAANFTSDSGSWTVTAGQQGTYSYTLIGKTAIVTVYLVNTTVAGTPAQLRVTLPGVVFAKTQGQPIHYFSGAAGTGECVVTGGTSQLLMVRDVLGTAWVAGTTHVIGTVTVAIQ